MDAAQKATLETPPLHTWAEICERCPEQWVCVADIEHEAGADVGPIRSARLLGHATTCRGSLDQITRYSRKYPLIGFFFTGAIRPPFPRFPRLVMTE